MLQSLRLPVATVLIQTLLISFSKGLTSNDCDWNWADDDGRVLKWTSGTDQWEAIMRRYLQLGLTRRNVQLVLTGITVGGAADPGF